MSRLMHSVFSAASIGGLFLLNLMTDGTAANLTIKLILVDETVACEPNGYRDHRDNNCQAWSADRADEIIEKSPLKAINNIPPSEIFLGNLFNGIAAYAEYVCPITQEGAAYPCSDPTERKAVLLLFEWDEPQHGTVSLTRRPTEIMTPYHDEHAMNGEQRWVNHQRADAFFPSYNVTWDLVAADGEKWELTTRSR